MMTKKIYLASNWRFGVLPGASASSGIANEVLRDADVKLVPVGRYKENR